MYNLNRFIVSSILLMTVSIVDTLISENKSAKLDMQTFQQELSAQSQLADVYIAQAENSFEKNINRTQDNTSINSKFLNMFK